MTRIAVITLGCEKNTVDSERYRAQLIAHGGVPVDEPSDAEVIVVNTCGFIDAAKKESIDALVEAGELKEAGSCRAVVAVGCLVERHKGELAEALPEVDLFLGASEMERLVPALEERGVILAPEVAHPGARVFSGELPHIRYLKVSEGCDHGCAFCAIPLMRGRHRSFAAADVLQEASLLELQGAREVNLVAQDLAHYGRDMRDGSSLTSMLKLLAARTSIPWYRLLYLYSAGVTPELLEFMASESRILPYLDMPIQHGNDAVLRRMRRPERRSSVRERVSLARQILPEVAIRTTVIVGFPGETESEFEELLDLLEELRFTSVGCFVYSAQEGTRAWEMDDDVPDEVKRERQERVSELQRALCGERNAELVGREVQVMVDQSSDGFSEGRIWFQAHDLDGVVTLSGLHSPGTIVRARVTGVESDYDLAGAVTEVLNAPRESAAAGAGRQLPLLLTTVGAFGR